METCHCRATVMNCYLCVAWLIFSAFLAPLSLRSVKSCFQNMEICKRRVNMYDTVNQSKTPFITHVAPSTSTNLTMTFNNQLNTVHNQVRVSITSSQCLKHLCQEGLEDEKQGSIPFNMPAKRWCLFTLLPLLFSSFSFLQAGSNLVTFVWRWNVALVVYVVVGVINPAYLGSCYGEKLISPLMQQAVLHSLGQAEVFVILQLFFKLALK